MVNKALKLKVQKRINWCLDKIKQRYGITINIKSVSYDLDNHVAGAAIPELQALEFNHILLKHNSVHFIENVVAHEVAHLAQAIIYPESLSGKRRQIHGKAWKEIMSVLEVEALRQYDYSLTPIHNLKPHRNYMCTHCSETIKLPMAQHDKIMKDPKNYKLTHTNCNSPLIFVGP